MIRKNAVIVICTVICLFTAVIVLLAVGGVSSDITADSTMQSSDNTTGALSSSSVTSAAIVTTLPTSQQSVATSEAPVTESDKAVLIEGVNNVCQYPRLPTGCEATALTTLLRYYGFDADAYEIAMKYMPRDKITYDKYGNRIGPDYNYVFAGDPTTDDGCGCYTPCLINTTQAYIAASQRQDEYTPVSLDGMPFNELLKEVSKGYPVLAIVSQGLKNTSEGSSWLTPSGETITWQRGHHAVVIIGYDFSKGIIKYADPMNSFDVTINSLSRFEHIYNVKGRHAMMISKQ